MKCEMRKILKIVLIVLMIIGIAFSIFNFISIKMKAFNPSPMGVWTIVNGSWECAGNGDECDLSLNIEQP